MKRFLKKAKEDDFYTKQIGKPNLKKKQQHLNMLVQPYIKRRLFTR